MVAALLQLVRILLLRSGLSARVLKLGFSTSVFSHEQSSCGCLLPLQVECSSPSAAMHPFPQAATLTGRCLTCLLLLRPSLPLGSRSPQELLQNLLPQLLPLSVVVEVGWDEALAAGLELVRRPDFDPTHTLTVR